MEDKMIKDIEKLNNFKNNIFIRYQKKPVGFSTYELGVDGHGGFVIRKDSINIITRQQPYAIMEAWEKI